MKLDHDCIRDVLIRIEENDFNAEITFPELCEQLPKYSEDVINYTCIKLSEARMIKGLFTESDFNSLPDTCSVYDLTFSGHEFLNNIRESKIWSKVKAIGLEVGATSVSAFSQIASGVIAALINAHLGLT